MVFPSDSAPPFVSVSPSVGSSSFVHIFFMVTILSNSVNLEESNEKSHFSLADNVSSTKLEDLFPIPFPPFNPSHVAFFSILKSMISFSH